MKTVIITNKHLHTMLDIWAPRYSSAYTDYDDKVALLAAYKVEKATPLILVEFTKAKHLADQRFCIRKDAVMQMPVDSNGNIACYAVKLSDFDTWETKAEVQNLITSFGW